jgi:hypothetical protein
VAELVSRRFLEFQGMPLKRHIGWTSVTDPATTTLPAACDVSALNGHTAVRLRYHPLKERKGAVRHLSRLARAAKTSGRSAGATMVATYGKHL